MEIEKIQSDDEMDIEIDFLEILNLMLRHLWIIILSAITFGLIAGAVTIMFITPKYESTTKLYVLNRQDSSMVTNSDVQSSLSLTKDYAELIKSRTVTEGVIHQLNLDLSHKDMLSKMKVATTSDTRIISITIEDEDPYMAAKIADCVRDVAADHIRSVMAIDAVNTVELANIPDMKSSPNTKKNILLAVVAGAFLAIAFVMISYLLNDNIQTQEDVEKYLKLSVLGTIPLTDVAKKQQKKGKKSKRRR